MKGRLEKTNKGWKVLYTKCVPHRMTMEWTSSLLLHPEYAKCYFLDEEDNNQEVEFEIVDYSQKCRECGETVERGRSCSKKCFMKPGNFIPTEKLEYAKLLKIL